MMEKIIQYIETLIRRHDFVIIPDLGGFIVQQNSTQIVDEQINPPLASLGFNSLMQTSDGLLAIEISRSEKISFRQAMELIAQTVSQVQGQLKKGKKVQCGQLGYFSMSAEDKIVFTPSGNYSMLPINYGLEPIFILSTEKKTTRDERRVIQITLPTTRSMIKYAAVVVAAVGLFFTAPKIVDASQDFAGFNPMNLFEQAENEVSEIPSTITTFTIAEPTAHVVHSMQQVVPHEKAHVIVSCWSDSGQADDYLTMLRAAGYDNSHILSSDKLQRVSIASFQTKKEATDFMNTLKTELPQFSDAWVYIEK